MAYCTVVSCIQKYPFSEVPNHQITAFILSEVFTIDSICTVSMQLYYCNSSKKLLHIFEQVVSIGWFLYYAKTSVRRELQGSADADINFRFELLASIVLTTIILVVKYHVSERYQIFEVISTAI